MREANGTTGGPLSQAPQSFAQCTSAHMLTKAKPATLQASAEDTRMPMHDIHVHGIKTCCC